jgi:hypothetical protein
LVLVVEYSSLTAALTVLLSSLNGLFGSVLPSSFTKASALVTASARSNHVSSSQAHAAYAQARYPKPVLRYLYAAGWIDAASHPADCKAALLLGPDPSAGAATAIEGHPKFVAQLRSAHVSVGQAAKTLGRGLTDGCA